MSRRHRKKISFLGTLAVAIGAVAWCARGKQILGEGVVVIGGCGVALGLLAMLGSTLLGNTGKFVPLLGILLCGSAIEFEIMHNSAGLGVVDELRSFVDRLAATAASPPVAKPAAPMPALSPSSQPLAEEKSVGSGTIFDMTASGKESLSQGSSAGERVPAPMISAANPSGAVVIPSEPAPNAIQRYTAAMAVVTRAHAKLDAATAALIPALSKRDDYQVARRELTAADVTLQNARTNDVPGSSELVAADQRYVNAKAAVQKLINQAAAADPGAIEAKQELIAAQGELRAVKEEIKIAAGRKAE